MVEFGLKLEDNKVAEWSEHYINYEKLKEILKKAKNAQKKCDEQAKKRPNDAQKIIDAHKSGDSKYVTITPSGSRTNLAAAASNEAVVSMTPPPVATPPPTRSGSQQPDDTQQQEQLQPITERTSLLGTRSPGGGTHHSGGGASATASVSSERAIESRDSALSLSGISDYFGSRYERSIRDSLKEIDKLEAHFNELFTSEVDKVSKFYYAKLEELETRLQLLVENVAASYSNVDTEIDDYRMDESHNLVLPNLKSGTTSVGHGTPLSSLSTRKQEQQSTPASKHRRKNSLPTVMKRVHTHGQRWLGTLKGADDEDFDDDEYNDDDGNGGKESLKRANKAGETDSIKRALIDQYRTAKLLHNFALMNYTACVKIVKKHDKTIPEAKGKYKSATQSKNLCNEGKAVDELANRLEKFFAIWFTDGDVRAAHAQMLPKRGDGLEMDWTQLRLGYRFGMCAVLGLWVCWDCVWGLVSDGNSTIGGRTAFPVLRACGGLLILQWFWACSVFVWTRYRVNYIYLFDFNPRIVATSLTLFQEAVDNTLIFLLLTLLYYKSGAHDIPQWIPAGGYPFIMVLYTVWNLIFPLRTRIPMWKAISKVVTAPLHSPNFFHGYIGDIFTSMVKVFQDVVWTVCWVGSGDFMISEDLKQSTKHEWSSLFWYRNVLIPIVCLLPLVIRFNQCLRRYADSGDRWPHLANAFKYAMSQTVTLFGAFHPLYLLHSRHQPGQTNWFQVFWLILFVSSSLYSFTWDVYMDWGLGRRKYGWLGQSLMYPRRYYYYSIIALDIVLRFMWVLTLVPPQSGAKFEVPQYLSAVTMMLELFRRTVWGFLRLENEHRSNAAGFRRVGFVPLHFHTGHQHKYKEEKHQRGFYVLTEVAIIALAVVGICVFSVVAAQRATRFVNMMERMEL